MQRALPRSARLPWQRLLALVFVGVGVALLVVRFGLSSPASPSSPPAPATPQERTVVATQVAAVATVPAHTTAAAVTFVGEPAATPVPSPLPPTAPAAPPTPAAPAVVPGTIFGEEVSPPWWPCQPGQLKGNDDSKIYHSPEGSFYAKTFEGVTCFNTASEAEAAGYRASKR